MRCIAPFLLPWRERPALENVFALIKKLKKSKKYLVIRIDIFNKTIYNINVTIETRQL